MIPGPDDMGPFDRNTEPETTVDEVLAPFGDFVEALAEIAEPLGSIDAGLVMEMESMDIRLPVEIAFARNGSGQMTLLAGPPTQRTETTIMPVFHGLRIRVTRDDG